MRDYRAPLIILIIVIIGIILTPFGVTGVVKDRTIGLAKPVTNFFVRIGNGYSTFKNTLFSINDVIKENDTLKMRNLKLETENIKMNELSHENEILRKELKLQKSSKFNLVAATVVAKSPTGFVDFVSIDKGTKDGLKQGMIVISNGFMVGTIESVYANNAKVLLLTSNNSKIPAMLQNSRGTGLVIGGLRGLRMEDIPLEVDVKNNEAITTSDFGKLVIKGVPVGYVERVISSESDMAQAAEVTSPIDFSKLEIVFVVKGSK